MLRGAAAACGLTAAAEAAGRLESVAAGLHEDDLEVGSADSKDLRALVAVLAVHVAAASADAPGERLPRPKAAVRSVLCIDDDETSRALVRLLLRARPDTSLLEAGDGRTGLAIARAQQPDVIVLDLRLPDLYGGDVLVALGTAPETTDIPVLLVSGDEAPAFATHYLRKPIDPGVFLSVLDDLLGQRRGRPFDTSHLEAADGVRSRR